MSETNVAENAFLVLGIPTCASRIEVERAGQKLLAQLAIGAISARYYETALGRRERDESKIRLALAALRDPEQRILHELWAEPSTSDETASVPLELTGWTDALRSIGWSRGCTD